MHEAGLVRRCQAVGDLDRHVEELFHWKCAPRQNLPQRRTVNQFGDDVGHVPFGADVIDNEDVWMVERAGRARFVKKPRLTKRIVSVGLVQIPRATVARAARQRLPAACRR